VQQVAQRRHGLIVAAVTQGYGNIAQETVAPSALDR